MITMADDASKFKPAKQKRISAWEKSIGNSPWLDSIVDASITEITNEIIASSVTTKHL